jgi:CysZ protein
MGLKFGIYSLFLNIIFLPFYFIPMIGFIIYFALNSYLLGREYYDISAISFIKKDNFKQHKKKISGKLNLMGLVISIGFITPLLNLIMPILAVIFSWLYIKNTQK